MPGHQSIQALSRLFLAGGLAGLGLLLSGCLGSGSSGGGGNGDGGNGDPGSGAAEPAAIQISTRALNQGVEVSWDGGDGGYTLYWSTDPDFDLDSHASSSDADSALGVDSPYLVTDLENRRNWYFRVESGDGVVSPVRGALPGPPTTLGSERVRTMAVAFDHLFIGGEFTGGGILNDSLMAVQRDTGHAAQGLGVGGLVRRILPDGEGGLFVAGGRLTVNGQENLVLVRLDANGQPDPDWLIQGSRSMDFVRAMRVTEDRVYVGGNFTGLDGVDQRYLAAIDRSDGSLDTDFRPGLLDNGVNSSVWALEVVDDRVLAVGFFTPADQPDQDGYALFRDDGNLVARQPDLNLDGAVPADLARLDDAFLVGGGFTDAGPDDDLSYLMRVTGDGEVSAVDVDVDGPVSSMDSSDAHVVMVGDFGEVNGHERNRFAAFDTDLALMPADPFTAAVDVFAMPSFWKSVRLHGDHAYVVQMNDADAGITGGVAEVDLANGLTRLNAAPSIQSPVAAMPLSDDLILLGGSPGLASGYREPALLVVDDEGSFSEAYRLGFGGGSEIQSLDVHDDRLYLGVRFSEVDGVIRTNLAAVSEDGELASWSPNPGSGRIYALQA